MNIFFYDKTFDGLLTVIFDAYFRKTFPHKLLMEGETLPLFYDEIVNVVTDEEKSRRVWASLQKKMSKQALSQLALSWLADYPDIDMLLFRYMCKNIDAPFSVEMNFGDPDVLELSKVWKLVSREKHRILQFTRFQKAMDGTYFAAFEPDHNALPLTVSHFKDRFSDQKWIIYDLKRQYGYYYDLETVTEINFDSKERHLITGMLDETLMAKDEKLFQKMWKTYFKSIAIKERTNPKLHRQHMPARYWKYLTEKQL